MTRDSMRMGILVGAILTAGQVLSLVIDLGVYGFGWVVSIGAVTGFVTMLGFGRWIDRHDEWVRDDFTKRLGKRIDADPEPPTNVRVVYEDGTEVPVECRYVGVEDGCATWEVATDYDVARTWGVATASLPAKTAIRAEFGADR